MYTRLWLLLAAFAGGLLATALARRVARRLGIVNNPNPIVPQHTRPIAYLGGLGVAGGIVLTALARPLLARLEPLRIDRALALGASTGQPVPLAQLEPAGPFAGQWSQGGAGIVDLPLELAVPGLCFLMIGLVDDLRVLSAGRKFLFQAIAATGAVAGGLSIPWTGYGAIDVLVSWFWLVTLVNAFNLVDVCDGLATSLAMASLLLLAAVDPQGLPLSLAVAGACAGFLVFNGPPASIFLGDAGSHLLGFLVGALVLRSPVLQGSTPLMRPVVAVLLVAVPLFELAFLAGVRMRKGLPWWKGSPDHFALRLQAAGLSRLETDLVACVVAISLGGLAIVLPTREPVVQAAAVVGVGLAIWGIVTLLLRWEVPPKPAVPTGTVKAGASIEA